MSAWLSIHEGKKVRVDRHRGAGKNDKLVLKQDLEIMVVYLSSLHDSIKRLWALTTAKDLLQINFFLHFGP